MLILKRYKLKCGMVDYHYPVPVPTPTSEWSHISVWVINFTMSDEKSVITLFNTFQSAKK